MAQPRVAIVGPVYPFRAGIAHCTTRLAEELDADVISFKRQYPKRFYPGADDVDPTLPRANGEFILDILNPLTWLRARRRLREYDAVIFVWWIWVWAVPYRFMMIGLPRVILQCHNVSDKEPAWWKRALTNIVLRRANVLVVHANTDAEEAWKRTRRDVVKAFLPVHEIGGGREAEGRRREAGGGGRESGAESRKPETESREPGTGGRKPETRISTPASGVRPPASASRSAATASRLPPPDPRPPAPDSRSPAHTALFFGHIRPFKGLDVALEAWKRIRSDVTLVVAGEPWFGLKPEPQRNVRFDLRFIPDAEVADFFNAADVVIAPYRNEAQSGVAMTAFHFGKPVIATRVGGLPEIIDDRNGILVAPEDPDALARAVDEFFTTCDRAAMARAAAASAKRFSWAEYGAIISRLVQRP